MTLRAFVLTFLVGLLVSGQKCSSKQLEEEICGKGRGGKLVVRDNQPVCVYPAPPTTTTTTTTTSTTTTTTLPRPTPIPPTAPPSAPPEACGLPRMPECGRSEGPTGVYGCCWVDKAKPLPHSPFNNLVDSEQDAIARERPDLFDRDGRVNQDHYVDELVRRLRAKGLCATVGGPGDELGLKASNGESFQYDVHLSNGRPRRSGYTAYCSPARF